MRRIVALFVALTACATHAQDDGMTIGLHLASVHSAPGMNNRNPGLYLRMPSGFTAGFYENSVSKTRFAGEGSPRRISTYAGWTWETSSRRFAVTIGAASGYGRKEYVACIENTPDGCVTQKMNSVPSVIPFAVPTVRFSVGTNTAARVGYIFTPEIGPKSKPVHGAHLMIEHAF